MGLLWILETEIPPLTHPLDGRSHTLPNRVDEINLLQRRTEEVYLSDDLQKAFWFHGLNTHLLEVGLKFLSIKQHSVRVTWSKSLAKAQ